MGLQVDFSRFDVMDFLDLAISVEEDAEDHYHQLASWMKGKVEPEVISFFQTMQEREAKHAEQLRRAREKKFGDTAPRHAGQVPWEVEAPDYESIGEKVSLREAYQLSLDMEKRAHDYYAEAKEYTSDPGVLQLLEGLRLAEVEHQRLVQERLDKLE
jgi:rubrerythrin